MCCSARTRSPHDRSFVHQAHADNPTGSGLAQCLSTLPVNLLETGKIAFTKMGRHRRIEYQDLLAHMERIDEESRQALDELSREAQELGMGY